MGVLATLLNMTVPKALQDLCILSKDRHILIEYQVVVLRMLVVRAKVLHG